MTRQCLKGFRELFLYWPARAETRQPTESRSSIHSNVAKIVSYIYLPCFGFVGRGLQKNTLVNH